ncbi:uncharacterized protein RCO7_14300 [Rhynchosporium graminicola]|uniref:Uncharacterized protein n=1 Tax=Rhynchosporium graminicola TaxID=2792576 RepID=A0A1E1K727_9HELO|nr:uncharacterized protein RCO7_14300 [Rhynchosporium commune]
MLSPLRFATSADLDVSVYHPKCKQRNPLLLEYKHRESPQNINRSNPKDMQQQTPEREWDELPGPRENKLAKGDDMAERAEDRVLGALRCHLFNLGRGNLVTSEKVDAKVAFTLQSLSDGVDLSDEGRLVMELYVHMDLTRRHGARTASDFIDMAMKIIRWAHERGRVDS